MGADSNIIQVLQQAVTPVVLISGVGLLLLTMTNRFGRLTDRTRELARLVKESTGKEQESFRAQLQVLSHRGRLLRRSIAEAGFCVLFASLLIITLFISTIADASVEWLDSTFFILSLCFLILSLVDFIRDVHLALSALSMEVGEDWKKTKKRKKKQP